MENTKKINKYKIDMCSGNLFWKIIIFSVPLALMGMLQLLFNAADLIIVSQFGGNHNALGAIGSTSTLISLSINLFMGLSVGTSTLCAKYFGSKEHNKISTVVHTSIILSAIIGVSLGIFGFFFADELLALMNNHDPLSIIYLRIYFIGMPFNLIYNFAASILQASGDTKRPLYFLTISGIINVLLNLLFTIKFNLGVAGVASATVISQLISCCLIMLTLMNTDDSYKFSFKKCVLTIKDLKDIIKIGLPAGIQASIFSIANVIIQTAVNSFGDTVKNGNAAASNVESFVYVAMNAVYLAALAFTSQNFGAKNEKNIKKITIYSLLIVSIIALSTGGTIFLFGENILQIYTKDVASIEVGYIRLHYLCLPYFLCGIMDVMVGVLRGIGCSTLPMIVSILGVCGIRITWIYVIFYPYTNFIDINDLNLLYISYPISWIITFTIHLICYFIISKKVFSSFKKDNLICSPI